MNEEIKKELQEKWTKNVIETNACIEALNKLNAEKEELIKLAESENPPKNILELLKQSEKQFALLVKQSENIKKQAKEIKEQIAKLEENDNV